MRRRSGIIETELRRAVQAYVNRHGHGSATKLGKLIKRTSAWVGLFVAGERRASIDDAIAIAKALNVDLHALIDGDSVRADANGSSLDLEPVDRREVMLQRLLVKISERGRGVVLTIARSVLQMEQDAAADATGTRRSKSSS